MCLAEALLRVPDALTADRLIAEKIQSGMAGSPWSIPVALRQRIHLGADVDWSPSQPG